MNNNVMFSLTYGLYVVTAREGSKDNGCITNTAAQVTATPNRISLTVNKANYTHDMIVVSKLAFSERIDTLNSPVRTIISWV